MALAYLIYLPRGVIATLALVTIAGHNLLDGIEANRFQDFRWLWLCCMSRVSWTRCPA